MTAYDGLITRTDAGPLQIPEEVSSLMLTNLTAQSLVLQLGTRIPVATKSVRFPILTALPVAYWVAGDTGLKQVSEMAWDNKFMTIEELAVIVPVPENVIDDSNFDIWGQVRPAVEGAIARKIDEAVVFGTGSPPGSFPTNLVAGAVAAGNVVARGTNAAGAGGGIYGDYSDLLATLEADGYLPNGAIGNVTVRARERNVRDTTGQPILRPDDMPAVQWALPGQWPTGVNAAELLLGDFTNLAIGVRSDFTFKMLDQAVITDNTGAVIYNLPQQDMIALRVTFRMGWQVANPINWNNSNAATRYPFAVLRSPAS